jgi:hypothetical protein
MKLYVPLLDNGNGSVMAVFMTDFLDAFRGRQYLTARASDSHANRGMNKIANAFLDSDCDVWINIDADIRFRRTDIDMLLEHAEAGIPLVYGIYPKKDHNTEPCLCTLPTVDIADPITGLLKVRRSGRGFMLVSRKLLEAMKEDNGGPALRYHNHATERSKPHEWDFFPSGVVVGEFSALDSSKSDAEGFQIREWISEDWYFCEVARKLGFPTLVDVRIALGHIGQREYRFNGDQVTRMDANITSWRHIHGWFDYADLYREIALKIPDGEGETEPSLFVEVGCWLGRSIAAMHEFLQDAGKRNVQLNVVDTFCGKPANEVQAGMLEAYGGNVEQAFIQNMKALKVTTNVFAMPSTEAAKHFPDNSISAIFIDGDHSQEAVQADIRAWYPKVKQDGIMAGHDIDESGVSAAVKYCLGDAFEVRGRCWFHNKAMVLHE